MRTTLSLDDDVLAAARALARQQCSTLGAVISGFPSESLRSPAEGTCDAEQEPSGLPLPPIRTSGAVVDLELVNQLRDERLLLWWVLNGSTILICPRHEHPGFDQSLSFQIPNYKLRGFI